MDKLFDRIGRIGDDAMRGKLAAAVRAVLDKYGGKCGG